MVTTIRRTACFMLLTFSEAGAWGTGATFRRSSLTTLLTGGHHVVTPATTLNRPRSVHISAIANDAAESLSSNSGAETRATEKIDKSALDKSELLKYAGATLLQFGFMAAFLFAADNFAATLNSAIPYLKLKERWSPWAVGLLFAFLSNNSRIFSFFDHRRPPAAAAVVSVPTAQPVAINATVGKQPLVKRLRWPPWLKRNSKRIRLVPFVWLAMTALRGWSSALVYGACGSLCAAPLLVLVAHLSVGDTWNHITNIERRIGVSTSSCVWLLASVALAVWSFYTASPRAGYLLAPSAVWISVACLLSWDIWRLNAPRQRLVPTVADGKATGWGLEYSLFGALWRLVTTGTRRHPLRKPVSDGQFEAVDGK